MTMQLTKQKSVRYFEMLKYQVLHRHSTDIQGSTITPLNLKNRSFQIHSDFH